MSQELKPCPFCGTAAISKSRLVDNQTGHLTHIICGNPFCNVICKTEEYASPKDAAEAWNERNPA